MKAGWICSSAVALMIVSLGGAFADEELARKSGCIECHGVAEKNIGPSLQAIAEKYKGDPGARNSLVKTVKNGGKGNWTEISRGVPMPPYSGRLSDSEIERLVDWLLDLRS